MSQMRQVLTLEIESQAVPTSYVGRLADGENVYIRYRHGRLTVQVSPTDDFFSDQAQLILEKTLGNKWAGVILIDQVVEETAEVLSFESSLVDRIMAEQQAFHQDNDDAWESFFASVSDHLED